MERAPRSGNARCGTRSVLRESTWVERAEAGREPGSWKGRISIDDSFFDPLPEDELAAWEQ